MYRYEVGDRYKVLSTVKEDVLVNGIFNHYAEIVNRISYEVSDVEADDFGGEKGFLEAIMGPLKATSAGIAVAIAFGYVISLIFTPKSPKGN